MGLGGHGAATSVVRFLSYVGQPAVEVSTISRVQPTDCCVRLSFEERIMEEWRSRPELIIGFIQDDRMKKRRVRDVE